MIVFQKATTTNNLTLFNLLDDASLSAPVYLFVFSKGGNDYPVILTDQATTAQQAEYSKFNITEGGNDPTNGNFTIGTTGVYDVVIYEQSSTTNLDPSLATKIRTDLARVIDSETSNYVEHVISVSYVEHTPAL